MKAATVLGLASTLIKTENPNRWSLDYNSPGWGTGILR